MLSHEAGSYLKPSLEADDFLRPINLRSLYANPYAIIAHLGYTLRIAQSKWLLRSARSLPCFDALGFPKGFVHLALRIFPHPLMLPICKKLTSKFIRFKKPLAFALFTHDGDAQTHRGSLLFGTSEIKIPDIIELSASFDRSSDRTLRLRRELMTPSSAHLWRSLNIHHTLS